MTNKTKSRIDLICSGEIVCSIINPSDGYTLRTDDFNLAAVAILLLGGGQLGLEEVDGDRRTPALVGWQDWLDREEIDIEEYTGRKAEMAGILDSVLIGRDREEDEIEIKAVALDKLESWLAKRHDRKRSSMNDIGAAAWALAVKLRADSDG